MLAVKAKHATMLLTVSDVEGLPEELEDLDEEKSRKFSGQSVVVREYYPISKLKKVGFVMQC